MLGSGVLKEDARGRVLQKRPQGMLSGLRNLQGSRYDNSQCLTEQELQASQDVLQILKKRIPKYKYDISKSSDIKVE